MSTSKIVKTEYVIERWDTIIMAELEDGTIEDLTMYYPDEYWLDKDDYIGLTVNEAVRRIRERDIAYLRS